MKKIFFIFVVILNANFALGAVVVNDTANGCNDSVNLYAMFEPNVYTCDSGYYLPANVEGCKPCPAEDSCVGGTFTFNEYFSQGIVYNQNITTDISYGCQSFDGRATAVFEPNSHDCTAGQYLPANVDACTQCPANSYCLGGTFTFNETTDQGISGQCDNGYSAPAGSSSVSDCVGNTITVRWDDGNGGAYLTTCTYGGTLTTPTTPPVAPKGYHFTGWSFNLGN